MMGLQFCDLSCPWQSTPATWKQWGNSGVSSATGWGGTGGTHLMAAIIVSGIPHSPNPPKSSVDPVVISAAACRDRVSVYVCVRVCARIPQFRYHAPAAIVWWAPNSALRRTTALSAVDLFHVH
jgi:hypothetical protein